MRAPLVMRVHDVLGDQVVLGDQSQIAPLVVVQVELVEEGGQRVAQRVGVERCESMPSLAINCLRLASSA